MQINAAASNLTTCGVESSAEFGISPEDTVHIMTILRDTLYTDRTLAVMREYSSNAWDSHRQSGCPDRPIKVTLPTVSAPSLKIRDFGAGLSEFDVFRVYTQYGRSTKRGTNNAVGFLGIGSKSGFAYCDQFTVTSWHGGFRRIFVASLDNSGIGVMQKLDEEPCGDETGIEVQIAVKPQHLAEFHTKARRLFRHFDPLPQINIDLPARSRVRLANGYIVMDDHSDDWVAVMGCVPYRVDISQLETDDNRTTLRVFHKVTGALYFGIGEVEVSASREELKYTDKTKAAIERKAEALLDEYAIHAFGALKDSPDSPWEQRQQVRFLKHQMQVPVPEELADLAVDSVSLKSPLFKVSCENRGSGTVYVGGSTALVIVDSKRPLKGFHLGYHDHLVKSEKELGVDELRVALDEALDRTKLTGIPVRLLSTLQWSPGGGSGRVKTVNPKHKTETFRLKPRSHFCTPYSECWEIEQREPQDDDVFVILSAFQAVGREIYSVYGTDAELVKSLGGTMPPVYGYKTTERKPLTVKDCKGTPYHEWRRKYLMSLVTPEYLALVLHWQWVKVLQMRYRHGDRMEIRVLARTVTEALGEKHPLTRFLTKHVKARTALDEYKVAGRSKYDLAASLYKLVSEGDEGRLRDPAKTALKALYARYPLLGLSEVGIETLTDREDQGKWLDYIKLVDRDLEAAAAKTPAQESLI